MRICIKLDQVRSGNSIASSPERQEAHHSFGHDLVGETWELILQRDTSVSGVVLPSHS